MIPVRGYAARSATAPLAPFDFRRRDPGPKDVLIDILYCGICHSDLHLVRNDWGRSIYPMVPGHDIVGRIVEKGLVLTYNSYEKDGKTVTRGGYSTKIVVDEDYALKVPPKLLLERVAPLLCAGITTYSPLRYWKIRKGHKVGGLGLGGFGHMAVKFASAL